MPFYKSHIIREERKDLDRAQSELPDLQVRCDKLRELVAKLEQDLAASIWRGKSSQPSDFASNADVSTLDLLQSVGEQQALGQIQTHQLSRRSLGDQNTEDADASLLIIITAQRDRLIEKVNQLQEELNVEKHRGGVLQSQIEKVRDDNIQLIGKIRFLQSYDANKSARPSSSTDVEQAYGDEYQNRLDPFRKFTQNESQKTYTKLKIHDKATLKIGKAIMTSASARLTFFFYLVVLHLLVFLVLYRFAFAESCERDFQQDCVEKFEQHMQQHHPKG